jgi:hypothetical protein
MDYSQLVDQMLSRVLKLAVIHTDIALPVIQLKSQRTGLRQGIGKDLNILLLCKMIQGSQLVHLNSFAPVRKPQVDPREAPP